MELTTIIYIAIAFVIGIVVTCFFKKGSNSDSTQLSKLNSEIEGLKLKLAEAEKKTKTAEANSSSKADEIKAKYEALLKEANAQVSKLDQQLKNAIDGNLDDSIKEQLADAENLKKKIRNLEDKLEDANDDLMGFYSKTQRDLSELEKERDELNDIVKQDDDDEQKKEDEKKKKVEIKDVTQSYQSVKNAFGEIVSFHQNKSKNLGNKLDDVKQQLKDKTEELELKMKSLNFIQKILSAKEISTSDTNRLYKNIDYFESFVKGQFTDLNSFLYTTYKLKWKGIEGKAGFEEKKKSFFNSFDQWASTKRKSWLDGKTTIAFVGEFSAGKTSIVNRIYTQDDPSITRLPVDNGVSTAIPTYIAGGSAVSFSFISGDAKRKTILEDTFKNVSKDILNQVKGVSSLIKYFVVTCKNPNLNGLSILDTPGFNSNDSEDHERTIDVINECDALFWVFDVNLGTVNRSSISIIKEKLNKPLYVVINKVDTKPESEVQKVENLIRETLTDAGIPVQQYIRFSEKAPLASIMNPIKAVNKIASRDTFVYDVKNDLEQLMKILDDGVKKYSESYDNVRQEGESLDDGIVGALQGLQNDCQDAYNIPQETDHWFSETDYRMTISEGNRMLNLLERSYNRAREIYDMINNRIDKAGEIQQEWADLCDLKAAWQKINDCYEQYKKVSKEIQ